MKDYGARFREKTEDINKIEEKVVNANPLVNRRIIKEEEPSLLGKATSIGSDIVTGRALGNAVNKVQASDFFSKTFGPETFKKEDIFSDRAIAGAKVFRDSAFEVGASLNQWKDRQKNTNQKVLESLVPESKKKVESNVLNRTLAGTYRTLEDFKLQVAYMGVKSFEAVGGGAFTALTYNKDVAEGKEEAGPIMSTLANIGAGVSALAEITTSGIEDEFTKKRTKAIVEEGIYGGATLGAGLAVKPIVKGAVKSTNYIVDGIRGTVGKRVDTIDEVVARMESQPVVQDFGVDTKAIEQDFIGLYNLIDEGRAKPKDLKLIEEKYQLLPTEKSYFEELLNSQSAKRKAEAQAKRTNTDFNGMKESTFKKIEKALNDKGYKPNLSTKDNLAKLKEVEKAFDPKVVQKAVNYIKNNSDDSILDTLYFYNQAKKEGVGRESIFDNSDIDIKSKALLDGLERGLLKKEGESFKLTAKGAENIQARNPDIPTYVLDDLENKGIAHLPEDIFEFHRARRNGESTSLTESKIIYDDIKGSRELNRLREALIRKQTGDALADSDIVANLETINKKFNLKIDETKLYDSLTGEVNIKYAEELAEAVTKIIKTDFLDYSKVKMLGKNKLLKKELGLQEEIFGRIFKEGEKLAKEKYDIQLKAREDFYRNKIEDIKNKFKDDKNSLVIEIRAIKRQRREELFELKAKARDVDGIKKLIEESVDDIRPSWMKSKEFKEIKNNVIAKLTTTDKYKKLNLKEDPSKDIAEIVSTLNKNFVEAMSGALRKKIIGEAKGVKPVARSTDAYKRFKYDTESRDLLLDTKELLSKYVDEFDYFSAEKILEELKRIKSDATKRAKKYRRELNLEANIQIQRAISEGINTNKGISDIDKSKKGTQYDRTWTKYLGTNIARNTKITLKNFIDTQKFKTYYFERIFGGTDKVGYKIMYTMSKNATDNAHKIKTTIIEPTAEALIKKYGRDGLDDLYLYLLALQKNGENFIGYDRIKYSNIARWGLAKTDLKGKPYPEVKYEEIKNKYTYISKEEWEADGIGFTRLGQAIKRADEFQDGRRVINKLFDTLHPLANKLSETYDGISITKNQDYLPLQVISSKGRSTRDIEFQDSLLVQNKVADSFTEGRQQSIKGGEVEYHDSIIELLIRAGGKQADYIAWKKTFETQKRFVNGVSYSFKDLDDVQKNAIFNNPDYTIIDAQGKIIDRDTGFSRDEQGRIIEATNGQIEDLYFQKKGGIRDQLTKHDREMFQSQLEFSSRAGKLDFTKDHPFLRRNVSRISAVPMVFNESPILKQFLVYVDAVPELGLGTLKSSLEVITNQSLRKQLLEIPTIHNRVHANLDRDLVQAGPDGVRGISDIYDGYINIGTWGIRKLDQETYMSLYLSSYKRSLKEQGKEFNGYIEDPEAMRFATEMADRLASTGDTALLPKNYQNIIIKSFYSLFTTQLNRTQRMFNEFGDWTSKTKKQKLKAINTLTFWLVSNTLDVVITYQIQKARFTLGLSKYDPVEEDMVNDLLNYESLYRVTLGQFLVPSQAYSLSQGFDASTTLSWYNSMASAIAKTPKIWEEFNESGELSKLGEAGLDIAQTFLGAPISRGRALFSEEE